MTDKELIQELKSNLATLRGMDGKLRRAMESMKKEDFIFLLSDGTWDKANPKQGWEYEIYRLRPDYQEPDDKVVECEVKRNDMGFFECRYNNRTLALYEASDSLNFEGFKYEDGCTSASVRLYKLESGDVQQLHYPIMGPYEVLTPTHVLFRGVK